MRDMTVGKTVANFRLDLPTEAHLSKVASQLVAQDPGHSAGLVRPKHAPEVQVVAAERHQRRVIDPVEGGGENLVVCGARSRQQGVLAPGEEVQALPPPLRIAVQHEDVLATGLRDREVSS